MAADDGDGERDSGSRLRRVSWMQQLGALRAYVADNGPLWTAYFVLHRLLGRVRRLRPLASLVDGAMSSLDRRMLATESSRQIPGRNSVSSNLTRWEGHNWSQGGEEWTPSPAWKQALVDDVLRRYVEPGGTVLEVGPGAGRWTEVLQTMAARLIVVDLSPTCIELCKRRFAGSSNLEFVVNDGRALPSVASESIDYVWSFDVFVHIAAPDVEAYLREFARVLRPGGRGVIHHANALQYPEDFPGWRSRMTDELFARLAARNGLRIVRQFQRFGADEQFQVYHGPYGDVISVFEKRPGSLVQGVLEPAGDRGPDVVQASDLTA
jgi:ubiquinone/menaquinone biosynthesis C-methylase UbiE